MPHISIQAEKIGVFFGLAITNSILTTWLAMGLLILAGFLLTRRLQIIPGNAQSIIEIVIESLYDLFASITQEKVKKFFPLLATLFIFIITANWIGLLPGVGSIGIKEDTQLIPLLRPPSADLNTTIALAAISILTIQFYGFKDLGFKAQLSKYINFKNPLYFFVGILEIISEFSRLISFAFRLFGNIFAGEVLLTIVAFLVPFIAPVPFLALEVFVGFIQALVFAMLTAVLLNVATSSEAH